MSRATVLAKHIASARADIAIVIMITALAAFLRLWHLSTVPLGLHGDEAWTGLDARRVLDEGWIGPYVPSALGQPSGPLYFTALLFKFFPETTLTIRTSMALFGIATIPLAYLAFAAMFNRTVAAFAALILSVMMWHLHLSRTGFMVGAWPFAEMLTLWLLWLAMRRRNAWLFLLAGAAHGLGVYTYNVYVAFLPVPFVALLWIFVAERERAAKLRTLLLAALFALGALLVAMPLVRYITDDVDRYQAHQKAVGLTDSVAWKDAGFEGKARLLWRRGHEWEGGLVYGDRFDFGDGLGTSGHPVVGPVVIFLALGGVGMALANARRAEYAVVLAATLLIPWGALLTVNDGLFRRTLGLAPFLALLAALPLAWIWDRALGLKREQRYGVYGLALLAPVYLGASTTHQYFGPVQDTPVMRYVYPYELDAASHYMNGLPSGTYVYFYSDRWSFDYETVRFEAPDARGEDRSREFRPPGDLRRPAVSYESGRAGPVAFVLLAPYLDGIREVQARYTGGEMTESVRDGEVLFRAYYLPAGAR